MISAGVKLMWLGLGTVFLYLLVMVFIINIFGRLLAASTFREMEEQKAAKAAAASSQKKPATGSKTAAVISAAVTAHRNK